MNITGLKVVDPRIEGQYVDPYIVVQTDEEVVEISDPIFDHEKSHAWRAVSCGPFWALEFRPVTGLIFWFDVNKLKPMNEYRRDPRLDKAVPDVGEFNKLGLIKDQLFPVHVETPEVPDDLFMSVVRLRRLLRRYDWDVDYQICVDEQAALLGLLKWRVELSHPVCYGGARPGQARCIERPDRTIVYKNTHLTLCETHAAEVSKRLATERRSS